ncbi:LysR family transcriptional regulator [Sneathiella sp. P13V-1]|uniref:LysR substrate-binding domain-containing protein n=1 Tax=Sneathiella sp. P13V-1 TaxID=2697366 RepID=UPI00187B529D|nr:LysR substrate-binding domain-containing protein [Sneathiella sp. P13V-1]MBE7637783.1 LysR family transcriptional regulator [Sneathiella sp. P13V-1]
MYPKLPSLNVLKTFDAAARLKSFKKASEKLNVTPTAVSHQIKALEEGLGVSLFERRTRAVKLTRDGELLLNTTANIFRELNSTVNEIVSGKEVLTISTTSSFASMWLVPNLEKFYKAHPDIEVSLQAGEKKIDVMRDPYIDLAIRYGKYDPTDPGTSILVTEKIGMYATQAYLDGLTNPEDATLLETEWVNKSLPAIAWKTLFRQQGHDKNHPTYIVRQFDQEHHVIQAALAGQGIALVSSILVENALKEQWLVPFTSSDLQGEIEGLTYYLVMPPHNQRKESVITFTEWLLAEIQNSAL